MITKDQDNTDRGGPDRGSANPGASDPRVLASVPRWRTAESVGLAWLQAGSLTVALVAVGGGIDSLRAGGDPAAAITVLTVSGLVAGAAAAAAAWHTAKVQGRAECLLRDDLVKSVHRGGLGGVAGRSGELLSLATDAVPRAARYRAAFLGPTVGTLTTPFLVLGLLAVLVDPVSSGILAVMLAVVPLIIGAAQRASRGAGGGHRREQARLTALFLQTVQGLGTLVAHGAADRADQTLAEQGERHRRSLMRVLAVNQITILVMDASVNLGLVLVAALLALHRLAAGALSLGGALAILFVSLLVIRPIDSVGQFFYIGIGGRAAQRALSAQFSAPSEAERAERVVSPDDTADADDTDREELRASAPQPQPQPQPQERDGESPAAAILLDRVSAGWDPERPVLHDFSLTVSPGEHVALVGPSGIGKSTVSAVIQGHLLPLAGTAVIDGVRAEPANLSRIRRSLSVVEQRTFLFHGTIADNLRIVSPHLGPSELWEALAFAGLEAEVRAMPLGLDTQVGEHGVLLSGGQSQRLAIARAAVHNAPILILDEPTSQVDLAGEAAFLDRLGRLALGRTVLTIAHRPGALLAADRTVSLETQEAV